MGTRGSLRSETRATHAALRGGGMGSLNAVGEDADATPPPSPQSAAMLAAFGFSLDGGEEEMKASASDSDSDFSAEETRPRQGRKRRLRQRTARPKEPKRQAKTRVEEKEKEEEAEEEVEDKEEKPTPRFKSDRRAQAQQNWVDDGCAATFGTRLHELRRSLQQSVREKRVTFYNRPRSAQEAEDEEEKEDEEMDEMEDGGFHDEREEDGGGSGGAISREEEEVYYSPHDRLTTDSGLSVPSYMYAHLFPHQKECLEWLHHLHERNTGGILGDEMGLGKTVQIASFLGAMYDAKRVRTVLLLCPASVLLQWVREFHKWYPWLRVVLLHASGTGGTRAGRNYAQLIEEVMQLGGDDEERGGGVVVSTYENVRQYQELFLDLEWDYVVLDEGHRIRNPDAEITLVCKQLQTVHRIILTGTPIQNRLRELWSLFDFVYPGKLGTLPTFEDEFVLPIRTGGYANASKMQVVMAYKCALALKEVINPFMLRRTKKEIQHVTKLPEKMEQILFCSLTARQYETYELFLSSPEVAAVLRQDMRPFRAISILRHICNHPDLLSTVGDYNVKSGDRGTDIRHLAKRPPGVPYGDPEGSGKMRVLDKVLALWKQQGHRVLVFTQTRKMLDILESFMAAKGYKHCRLDGTTSVKERQSLLDAFNRDGSEIFVFLLTTRAGGIGVNLTGADRVVIFDPDWNPSTDLQARERSWRLGQTKQVTVYRLITSGTIEEKIYHRQIFKQYLTNKVLHDAKRKRCFNKHSLRDLFILGDQSTTENGGSVETTELFLEGNVAHPGEQSREGMEDGEIEEEGLASDTDRLGDSAEERDAEDKPSGGSGGGDNNEILRQLFDGDQMIQGVFNHDVVESDGVQNQEADLIELESSKIAQSALGALRASCALVRQQRASLFTPTWTGRSGVAGDPTQRSSGSGVTGAGPRFGNRVARGRQGSGAVVNLVGNRGGSASVARVSTNPFAQATTSSRDMLARMKNRKNGIANGGGTTRVNTRPAAASTSHLGSNGFLKADDMATQLHAFLLLRSKPPRAPGVTTEELLDGFGAVVAPKDKLVFRTLLRDMAVCRGRKWVLKDEFLTGL